MPLVSKEVTLLQSDNYMNVEPNTFTSGQCIHLDIMEGCGHMDYFDHKYRGLNKENCLNLRA